MRRSRTAAFATLLLLLASLGALIAIKTPWHPLAGPVPGGAVHPDASRDFSVAQIRTETHYHDTIRPWGLTGLALSLLIPAALGFTPLGRRLLRRLAARHWLLQALAGTVLVTLLTAVVTLPVAAREHTIERHYRLTLEGWGSWAGDAARSYLVVVVSTAIGISVIVGCARRWRNSWWLPTAVLAGTLVVAGSFVYPYVVEPVFNNFHSLPAGPMRSELLGLARQDHQPLSDILVADASRRTTTENAYVSGFGASRRLVVYDTLLRQDTPAEVRVIVGHELGHAKYDDVLIGTSEGALGVAAAMCALFLLVGQRARRPDRVPLLLALYAVVGFAVTPLTNVVSRHIEARADAHALMLTRDPATYVQAQKNLAVAGLDDLEPARILYVFFFSHPSPPERIAMARDWARQHHVPSP
jgi:STE24 endopeptidase